MRAMVDPADTDQVFGGRNEKLRVYWDMVDFRGTFLTLVEITVGLSASARGNHFICGGQRRLSFRHPCRHGLGDG